MSTITLTHPEDSSVMDKITWAHDRVGAWSATTNEAGVPVAFVWCDPNASNFTWRAGNVFGTAPTASEAKEACEKYYLGRKSADAIVSAWITIL